MSAVTEPVPAPRAVAPALVADGVAAASAARDQVVERYRRHLGRGKASLGEFLAAPVEESSSGNYVRTHDGRDLLDCGGYSVFLLGHRHPDVVAAVSEQLHRHPLAGRLLFEPRVAEAAAALARVLPPGIDQVQFLNSGAEATELALKLARAHGHDRVVTMTGGYHGKTLAALSVTPNEGYQAPFRPLLPGVHTIRYGDAAALEEALSELGRRACVILEPIQGEGGVVLPPPGYLARVARLVEAHGAFLVVDEIQSGLGRCGHWWAGQPELATADVVLAGKALSGGVIPVAAVCATAGAFAPVGNDPALHSSTFGGNPLAAAAVVATLEVLERDRLVERAAALGRHMLAALRADLLPRHAGLVTDVRGSGLLIGVQLRSPDLVAELVAELLNEGVLGNHSLTGHGVLRLTPPATLTDAEADRAVAALGRAVASVSRTVI